MFTRLKQLKKTAHEYNKAPVKPSAGFMPEGLVVTQKWWKQRNLRTLNLFLLIPLLSIFSQGFDGSMMNGLQSVTQWQKYFGRPTGATLGLFNAAYPMGGIVGVFFISPVSDTYGRRAGIATGAAVSILGAVLQASASHISTFVVARFVLGIGCVITAGVGSPFVTEIAHPKQRTTATGLFLTFYSLGAIVAAWCTFGTFRVNNSAAWRIPSALQGFPSLIQLALIWWVPESPRWLASKGRHEEAWSIICHYHAEDNPHDPLALFEFTSIKVALSSQPTHKTIIASWFEFLSTSANRRRTAILIWAALVSQLSGNAFVSYYLSPILTSIGLTSDLQQTLINATSQLLSWFSAVYFATLIPKLGRRTMFLWSLVAIWICDIVITIGSASFSSSPPVKPNKAAAYTVVVFLYLFSPAYNFGWNGNLGLYIPEILPYHLRTKGLALFYFFQFSFGILSAFATPVGLKNMGWKFYCIFVGWVVVEFLGVWWGFVETKGPGLEDLWFVFDEGRGVAGGVVGSSDGVKQFVKVGEDVVVEEVAKRDEAEAEASGKAIVNQELVG